MTARNSRPMLKHLMENVIEIKNLSKTYEGGFQALSEINLNIRKGEIFALLGPNGAGKTTLISTICGIVNATSGSVSVGGFDIVNDYRNSRKLIGLVPQELTTEAFETVWNTVSLSRGLFGKSPNPAHIEKTLKALSLWDKKDNKIMTLSGGMKRRVLIAKALSHEPQVLFLDEPTAGVDVDLRKGMWSLVHELRQTGVTVILTTHYIEEAEEMADRVGVINKGKLIVVEEKKELMKKMGSKKVTIQLNDPMSSLPEDMKQAGVEATDSGRVLSFVYDTRSEKDDICDFFDLLKKHHIAFNDVTTKQSSLEEIFVSLVNQ